MRRFQTIPRESGVRGKRFREEGEGRGRKRLVSSVLTYSVYPTAMNIPKPHSYWNPSAENIAQVSPRNRFVICMSVAARNYEYGHVAENGGEKSEFASVRRQEMSINQEMNSPNLSPNRRLTFRHSPRFARLRTSSST